MVVPLFGRIVVSDYLRSSHWSTEPGGGATGRNAASWLVEREEERNGSWCSFVAIVRFWRLIGLNCRQIRIIGFLQFILTKCCHNKLKIKCVLNNSFFWVSAISRISWFSWKLSQPLRLSSWFQSLTNILANVTFKFQSDENPWKFQFLYEYLVFFSSEWFLLCLTIS